jgi:malate permease and related proteins
MVTPFFVLFSLMGIGYIFGRAGWLTPAMNEGLSNILVDIAMPALLLSSIIELKIEGKILGEFTMMTALSVGLFFLYALLALPYMRLTKTPKAQRGMLQLSMLSSNNGFMGFPITIAFFGQKGLLLMVANNLAMGVVLWTYGVYALQKCRESEGEGVGKTSSKEKLKQILNTNVIAILVGLFIGITGMNGYIPDAVKTLLSTAGSLATPLSMIYIGVTLARAKFSRLSNDHMVVGAAVVRSVVFFAVTAGVVYFLPISTLAKQICVLVTALPSAAIVPVMTAKYGLGIKESTKFVVLSTLLSLVTAPLGVYLAYRLF